MFLKVTLEVKICREPAERNTSKVLLGKSCLGGPALDGLSPATLDDLEDAFPRDRFLALDIETTGLSAVSDRVRTVQFSDGENVAILIFDRPVPARALVVLSDFLHGRRVVVHNARFEGAGFARRGSTSFSTIRRCCSRPSGGRACPVSRRQAA